MELLEINESPLAEVDVIEEVSSDQFIAANTKLINYERLMNGCMIPVFAKDNETTISHAEFISSVQSVLDKVYYDQHILAPCIRVSHPIKGRIPQAMGKPANMLEEYEKTIYYERMGFVIEIPGISEMVNGNSLSLTIGGVRAYNIENLHNRKVEERFKVFVGFKNRVCTNLCISTDGYASEIRVRSLSELKEYVYRLITQFDAKKQLSNLNSMSGYSVTESQFASLVGKARMYQYLPEKIKKAIPSLQLGDSQVSSVVRDYYKDDSFARDNNGNIDLWRLYNLFTSATKSSYLDTFLDRNVGST